MFDKTKVSDVLIAFRKEHETDDEAPAVIFQLIYDICMSLFFTQEEALRLIGPYAAAFDDLPPYLIPMHNSPAGNLHDLRILIEQACESDGVGIVVTGLLWDVCKAALIEKDLRPYVLGLSNYDEWAMTQVLL